MSPPGHEPFLRAICANPDDDIPRLVYADWLDENGDPERAEFIRCQIAHARGRAGKSAYRRAEHLLKLYKPAWRAELPALKSVDWSDFSRGFISTVSLRHDPAFGDLCDRVLAAAPIQRMKLIHCRPHMLAALARGSRLRWIKSLDAPTGWADDDALESLAACPDTNELEELVLSCEYWCVFPTGPERWATDRAADAMARSPYFAKLKRLTLRHVQFSPDALAALRERFGPGVMWTQSRMA
jgi:uncharacterized protein (TIGR02996 family)